MGFDIKDRNPQRLISIPGTAGEEHTGFDPVNDVRELSDVGAEELAGLFRVSSAAPASGMAQFAPRSSAIRFSDMEYAISDILGEIDDGYIRVAPQIDNWQKFLKPDASEYLYNPATNNWEEIKHFNFTTMSEAQKREVLQSGYVPLEDGRLAKAGQLPSGDEVILDLATNPENKVSGAPIRDMKLILNGEDILWNTVGSSTAQVLDKTLVGETVYTKLKAQIGSSGTDRFKTYYDINMPKYYTVADFIQSKNDTEAVTLKLSESGLFRKIKEDQSIAEIMMALATFGSAKFATDIDFTNGTITFGNAVDDKSPKQLAMDALNLICGRNTITGGRRNFLDPRAHSVAYYIQQNESGKAIIDPSWMWLLTDSLTGHQSVVSTTKIEDVTFGDFNAELSDMRTDSVNQDQFMYFVLTENESGSPEYKLLDIQDPRNQNVVIPNRDLNGLPAQLATMKTVSTEQERSFFAQPKNSNDVRVSLPGMSEQTFKILPTDDYFFTYNSSAGETYRVLRVPVSNRLATEASDYQELGYMTYDQLELFSSVFDVSSETGFSSSLVVDGDKSIETFNVDGELDKAFYYKSNIQRLAISNNIVTLARELQTLGAKFKLTDEMTSGQVFEALVKFFENDNNDAEFSPDGDFSDPEAWIDPQGRVLSFAGNELPYKLAMYVVAISIKFSSKSEKIGENFLDVQEQGIVRGENLQYVFMAFMALQNVFGIVSQVRAQRQLYKEAMATQMVEADAARELAKKMMDPNWCPDFMSPMFDPRELNEPNPYFATKERELHIRQTMESLTGGAFSAAFLLGDAGVGKTELMREIQRRLMLPEQEALSLGVPRKLLGKTIYMIDGNKWDARNGTVGADSKTVAEFMLFMKRQTNAIAFFDEAEKLTSSGLHGGGSSGGKVLGATPFEKMLVYLSDRQLYAVFATTSSEYEKSFAHDPRFEAFLRRVEKVKLNPFSVTEVKVALAEIYPVLLEKYKVVSLDTEEKVTLKYIDASGAQQTIQIPKMINDLVEDVNTEAYVQQHPNVLMDFSIKRLKILTEKIIRDVSDYNPDPTRGRAVLAESVDHSLGTDLERLEKLRAERVRVKGEIETASVKSDTWFNELWSYIHSVPDSIQKLPESKQRAVKGVILAGMSLGAGMSVGLGAEGFSYVDMGLTTVSVYTGLRALSQTSAWITFKAWVDKTPFKQSFDSFFKNLAHWESELKKINEQISGLEKKLFERAGDPELIDTYTYRKKAVDTEIELIYGKLGYVRNDAGLFIPMTQAQREAAKVQYARLYSEASGEVTQKRTRLDEIQKDLAAKRARHREAVLELEALLQIPETERDHPTKQKITSLKSEIDGLKDTVIPQLSAEYTALNEELYLFKVQEEVLKYKTGQLTLTEREKTELQERLKKLKKKSEDYTKTIEQLSKHTAKGGIVLNAGTWDAYREEILKEASDEAQAEANGTVPATDVAASTPIDSSAPTTPSPDPTSPAAPAVDGDDDIDDDLDLGPVDSIDNTPTLSDVQSIYSNVIGIDTVALSSATDLTQANQILEQRLNTTLTIGTAFRRFATEYRTLYKNLNKQGPLFARKDEILAALATKRIEELQNGQQPQSTQSLLTQVAADLNLAPDLTESLVKKGEKLDDALKSNGLDASTVNLDSSAYIKPNAPEPTIAAPAPAAPAAPVLSPLERATQTVSAYPGGSELLAEIKKVSEGLVTRLKDAGVTLDPDAEAKIAEMIVIEVARRIEAGEPLTGFQNIIDSDVKAYVNPDAAHADAYKVFARTAKTALVRFQLQMPSGSVTGSAATPVTGPIQSATPSTAPIPSRSAATGLPSSPAGVLPSVAGSDVDTEVTDPNVTPTPNPKVTP